MSKKLGSEIELINIRNLIGEAKCYSVIREIRWPERVSCPHFNKTEIIKKDLQAKRKIISAISAKAAILNLTA